MEALLFKEEGAIAVVATTDVIGYEPNWNYLQNLFGNTSDDELKFDLSNNAGIEGFVSYEIDCHPGEINCRLGELVRLAKNIVIDDNENPTPYFTKDYKFHTFGDPALRLPFPAVKDDIIRDYPGQISLIQEQTVSVEESGKNSTLLV